MPPTLEEDEQGGDTIVVKGEYTWSRPSTPESMSPEIEPLVANLLAQINTTQNLESPEPSEDIPSRVEPSNPPPDQQAYQTPTPNKRQRTNVITMEERLQQMPEKRPMPWRLGVEPGADTETGGESRRKQIRFGCLLATRGDVAPVPCNSCANGRGKFSVCVALDGYFKGACASCQLSGRPNRCSIKKSDDVTESPGVDLASGDISLNKNQQEPSTSTPHSSSTRQTKRRRTNEGPEWEVPRPRWEQDPGAQGPQQLDLAYRQWATVNQPALISAVQSNGGQRTKSLPQNSVDQPISTGWATVNQPKSGPGPQALKDDVDSNGNSLRINPEQEGREGTIINDEGSIALIDTLPKNKQRQVYGLVSGLQGGIEHLQRELDSLKKALGIDNEN